MRYVSVTEQATSKELVKCKKEIDSLHRERGKINLLRSYPSQVGESAEIDPSACIAAAVSVMRVASAITAAAAT